MDDAFVHRGAGTGLGQHALAGVIAVAAGVGAVLAFERLRPGLRAFLAFAFGGLALVNGGLHVAHVTSARRRRRRRDGRARGRRGRRAARARRGDPVAAPRPRHVAQPPGRRSSAASSPRCSCSGRSRSGSSRRTSGASRSATRRAPRTARSGFDAADGLELAGWYRPSHNGAAVLVVHGGGSDRKGSVAHASMLARHGYGVLLYDARGRGESEGTPNNYGWDWAKDVAGALDFLPRAGRRRPAPDRRRSACRPAPTCCSRSPARAATTSPRSSRTARPPARTRTGIACAATSSAWCRAG